MSIQADAFGGGRREGGALVSLLPEGGFTQLGQTVSGRIQHVSEVQSRDNKFNPGVKENVITISFDLPQGFVQPPKSDPEQDDVTALAIWAVVGKPMAEAIRDSIHASGQSTLEAGGMLQLTLSETKDVGKGYDLKLYSAVYQPPVASAAATQFAPQQQQPMQAQPMQQQPMQQQPVQQQPVQQQPMQQVPVQQMQQVQPGMQPLAVGTPPNGFAPGEEPF